jgi:hypothetical protein
MTSSIATVMQVAEFLKNNRPSDDWLKGLGEYLAWQESNNSDICLVMITDPHPKGSASGEKMGTVFVLKPKLYCTQKGETSHALMDAEDLEIVLLRILHTGITKTLEEKSLPGVPPNWTMRFLEHQPMPPQ